MFDSVQSTFRAVAVGGLLCLFTGFGCGTTRSKLATEQLLLSDAVDRSVARIDFSPLGGESVFLDTSYLRQVKGTSFVNADYIISSLRQQMVLAGCLLQDNRDDAKYIAEPRVGVLGSDGHDVNYGVPGSNGLTAAASLVGGTLPLPSLPEISFARKTDDTAATKIAVFAYDRESRQPVWQSGLSVARSRAQARWILGAGPFQTGTIYEGTQFAGHRLASSPLRGIKPHPLAAEDTAYRNAAVWDKRLQRKLSEVDSHAMLAEKATEKRDAEKREADAETEPEEMSEVQKARFAEQVASDVPTESAD